MSAAVAAAIVLWAAAGAIVLGYTMLWMTSRNGDSPWLAAATAFLVLAGGVSLAAKDNPWVIGGFMLVAAQCLILYLMWRIWSRRPQGQTPAKELTTT